MVSSIPNNNLPVIIRFQVFLFHTNNLPVIIWFQVFLSNTNNLQAIVWFQETSYKYP